MSAERDDWRIPFTPEVWMVPPTLADFECEHGRIGSCPECKAKRMLELAAAMEEELLERLHEVKNGGEGVNPLFCRIYSCNRYAEDGSEFCSEHKHMAPANGRELLDRMDAGEPVAEPEEDETVVAIPADQLEDEIEQTVAEHLAEEKRQKVGRWTREAIVAAIKVVGDPLGRAPSHAEMKSAGYGGALAGTTVKRLGVTVAELVAEAGFTPRVRGEHDRSMGKRKRGTDRDRKKTDPVREPEPKREPEPEQDVAALVSALTSGAPAFVEALNSEATRLEERAKRLRRLAEGLAEFDEGGE